MIMKKSAPMNKLLSTPCIKKGERGEEEEEKKS